VSGLNDLEPGADITSDGGRGLLQQTLDKMSNAFRSVREELTKVRESDKIVAPIPIEEFPTIMGPSPSAVGGAPQNSILFSKTDATPAGYATCDGTNGTPDLQGRVPMGAGAGSGLTARAVGDVIGAETVAADLAAHTHDLSNHTHSTPAHAHTMAHTHDMGNHTHSTAFLHTPGAGGLGPGPAYNVAATNSNQVNHASGGPSTNTTSQPSTSVTSTDGSGTSGNPSNNSTSSAGAGGGHANVQPSRVLKALMKTTAGDIDLPRKCPIFFGRVPGLFDLEGQSSIIGATAADAYEVIETGRPPEKISELLLSSGIAGGQSSCVLRFSTYVPYNFRRWKTAAVRLRCKVALTGCAALSSATITLKARKPTSTSAFLVGTHARTLNVNGSGAIGDSAWVDMVLKTTDLQDDWQPGYFLACEVTFSVPLTFTTCSLKVGRLQINW
jgi:hypothetical protein